MSSISPPSLPPSLSATSRKISQQLASSITKKLLLSSTLSQQQQETTLTSSSSSSSSSTITQHDNTNTNTKDNGNNINKNIIIPNSAVTGFSLLTILSTTADIVMIIGTAPGWIMQLRSILHKGSAAGFSWQTALLLLFCYTIRVGYYFGEHFHVALLLQCFVMMTVVLSLIAAIVDSPDSSTPLTKYQFQHITKSDNVVFNESTQVTEDELNTYVHTADEERHFATLHPMIATAKRIFEKLFKRRWAGGSYYFGFIPWDGPNTKLVYGIYFTILGVVCYVCSHRLPGNPFLTKVVGFIALGIEGSVVLPQVYLTEQRRSVEGLSKFLVGTWFFGDLLKVLYFLGKSQPTPFVVCGVFQFCLDLFIIGQFARFKENKNVGAQPKQRNGVTLQKL